MNAFPEDVAYEDETTGIKEAIKLAHTAGDSEGLAALVRTLEVLNPTERCATSPLLDGFWETLYASTPARWTRGGRLRHVIESWSEGTSPGMPGLLAGPRGNQWDDVSQGRGAYVQRARLRFGSSELRATFTWLGGEAWEVKYVSQARLLLGIPVWRRRVRDGASIDLDLAVRPTFVDGELCILRAPAVTAGDHQLRPERVYLLRRMKNRLWQDGTFKGLSDQPVLGFELEP